MTSKKSTLTGRINIGKDTESKLIEAGIDSFEKLNGGHRIINIINMNEFEPLCKEIEELMKFWEPKLLSLPEETISQRRNNQNRTIKQITGHLIDSASNNIHRIVHLQNLESPLVYPNYASLGNNDRWIAIQDYQNEEWNILVQLMNYSFLHICHIIRNINPEKLNNEWIAGPDRNIKLKDLIVDFLRHLKLHLSEIDELINK
jgi:hypothetical protein